MFKQYGMKQLRNPVVRVRSLWNGCECLRLFELVDRTELIRLQQCGPGLSLFELADKGDDHYLSLVFSELALMFAPPESSFHQIVVPDSLCPKLLQIAHEIPAAGHVGVAKTQNRFLRHFVWPSISRDTKSFCCSCAICQRVGKGKEPVPTPLQSMPLVSEPFAQVAIDIIGPLPVCQESGNRFVLTVLDHSVPSLPGSHLSEAAH